MTTPTTAEKPDCPRCKGSGEAMATTTHRGPDDYDYLTECWECGGTGESVAPAAEIAPPATPEPPEPADVLWSELVAAEDAWEAYLGSHPNGDPDGPEGRRLDAAWAAVRAAQASAPSVQVVEPLSDEQLRLKALCFASPTAQPATSQQTKDVGVSPQAGPGSTLQPQAASPAIPDAAGSGRSDQSNTEN